MAKNNVQNVRFLHNGSLYTTREEALTKLRDELTPVVIDNKKTYE